MITDFSEGIRSKVRSYKEYCEDQTYTVLSVEVWHTLIPKATFRKDIAYPGDIELPLCAETVRTDLSFLYGEAIKKLGEYYNFYINL